MTEQNDLVEQFKQAQAALGHGCHDGYCVIEKPVGMHTNGGCHCLEDMTFTERQYVGRMLRIAQELVEQNTRLYSLNANASGVMKKALADKAISDEWAWIVSDTIEMLEEGCEAND